MNDFFKNSIEIAPHEAIESLCKTLIMNDDSEYAQSVRISYYKDKLKHMGSNVRIGKGVTIKNPQFVSLGDNVNIEDGCTLIARGEGGICLEDNVSLKERVYLDTESAESGYIRVGKNCYIGVGTTLFGHHGLEIGDNCLLAQNITLTPYSHKYEQAELLIAQQGGHCKKVTIGDDCYIGMRVCIMYSGDIGQGSVIGAGSVVVKPIPPYSIAVGVPAKVIKKRGN